MFLTNIMKNNWFFELVYFNWTNHKNEKYKITMNIMKIEDPFPLLPWGFGLDSLSLLSFESRILEESWLENFCQNWKQPCLPDLEWGKATITGPCPIWDIRLLNQHGCSTLFDHYFGHTDANILILTLDLATIVGAYLDNWEKFNEYSFLLISLDED